jgi:hypothetical protein
MDERMGPRVSQFRLIHHDFVQWLDEIATPRQRKKVLDNLMVVTALFYPASERVDSIEKLI